MTSWTDLFAELDRWPAGTATFWWRDDDASTRTTKLARLLALSDQPLAIAVVPARMRVSLAEQISEPRIDVLQHGFSHSNYQPPEEKKTELGNARPVSAVTDELQRGWQRLSVLYGKRALRVVVPPWNRIADGVVEALPGLGYIGLSVDQPRVNKDDGLIRVNSHIDIMNWEEEPYRFIGEDSCLNAAVTHLTMRRTGEADMGEPTGLLTHHLAMDDAGFSFTAEFIKRTAAHPAVQWRRARDIFAPGKG